MKNYGILKTDIFMMKQFVESSEKSKKTMISVNHFILFSLTLNLAQHATRQMFLREGT